MVIRRHDRSIFRAAIAAASYVAAALPCMVAAAAEGPPGPVPPGEASPSPPQAKSPETAAPSEGAPPAAKRPGKPPVPSRTELLDGLYGQLAKSPNAETSATIVAAIEEVWAQSGSPTVDVLMERAIQAVEQKRADLALQLLDAIVELKPDYPEGFARRAFVHVMQDDRRRALGDLRRVLALDPNNFRALEGLGQVLRDVGEKKAALEAVRQLLKIHPYADGAKELENELRREVEGQGI
ncbi:MAG: tetratricopeptide repeat protein [Hyphomicrobium sp.]|nr:tetratricopeptide repeat protein [Hyphomicrobium sp.]